MESSQVTMGGETGTIRLRFRFSHQQQAKGEDTVAKRKTMSTSKQREMGATEYGRTDHGRNLAVASSLARLFSNFTKSATGAFMN
jgi:hypothetical protein